MATLAAVDYVLELDGEGLRGSIIRFLDYNPLPAAHGWGERLVRHRTSLGLSQEEAARRIGVDPSTLAKWERGEREPTGGLLGKVKWFLCDEEAADLETRRVG